MNNKFLIFLNKYFFNAILAMLSAAVIMGITYFFVLWIFASSGWAIGLSVTALVVYVFCLIGFWVDENEG